MDQTERDRARELGFLRPEKYGHMERERRWLCPAPPCPAVPHPAIPAATRACDIEDTYIDGSRMRLRLMRFDDGTVERKLTKKAELSPDRRIITTIYLSDAEYALLLGLEGATLRKRRSFHPGPPEITLDTFPDGLTLVEVEFASAQAARDYVAPDWFGEEVTRNPEHSGHRIAQRMAKEQQRTN